MYYSCKVTGMETRKGYRHLGFNSQSIRDCIQIINAHGGFPVEQNPAWIGSPLFGKSLPLYSRLPKEYYDCVEKNARLNGQNIRQNKQKMRQLTRRVLQLEKL